MKKISKLAALCLVSCISISAHAALVAVDPDDFASGTDISNLFDDITLTTCFNGPGICDNSGGVFSLNSPHSTTGNRAFAHSSTNDTWGNGVFEWLRVDFDVAVDFVSLDFAANDGGGDTNPQLLAFDSFGTQIDISSDDFVASGEFVTLTVTGTNIASIGAYWDEINRQESGSLDNLVYNTVEVSAPASIAILGLGIVGLGLVRRKKRL